MNLAFEITLRLAEIGETRCGIIHPMQADEIFDERFAECGALFRLRNPNLRGSFLRRMTAVNRLHYVKGRADDVIVVAIKERLGSGRVHGVKLR